MIKCEKCGANIPDNSQFCMNCGSKIGISPPKHFSLDEIARQQQEQENNAFSIAPDTPDDDPETYLPPIGAKEHSEIPVGEIDPEYFNHKPLPNIQAADPLELLDSDSPELPPIGFSDQMQMEDIKMPEGTRHYHSHDVVPKHFQMQTAFPLYKKGNVINAVTQAQATRNNIARMGQSMQEHFSVVPEELHIRFREPDTIPDSVQRTVSFNPVFVDEYIPERDIPPVKPKTVSLEKNLSPEPVPTETVPPKVSLEKKSVPEVPKVSLEKNIPPIQPDISERPKVSLEKQHEPNFSVEPVTENAPTFSSTETTELPQNNFQSPSFETSQQNNFQSPSFGTSQQNNFQSPSFGTSQQNNFQSPSFGTSQQNNFQSPSFGTAQQNNFQSPSFGTAQQNNFQSSNFGTSQPPQNDFLFSDFGRSSSQSSMDAMIAEQRNQRNAKITLIVVVVLILLLVSAIGAMLLTGYYSFDSESQKIYTNRSAVGITLSDDVNADDIKWSNLNNGGLASADDEGNVYYSNSSGCICKRDVNGESSVIYNGSRTNKYIIYIQYYQDKVYFLSSITGTSYSICSVDKDGSNFKLYSVTGKPIALFTDNDFLYYVSDDLQNVYRLNIQTQAVEHVYNINGSESINCLFISNGKMYVLCMPETYEGHIEVIDTDTLSHTATMNLNHSGHTLFPATMCCYGDRIFFVDGSERTVGQVYSVNMDGTDIKRLGGNSTIKIAVYGEQIYFLHLTDRIQDASGIVEEFQNGMIPDVISLSVMNTDGSNIRNVLDTSVMLYSLAGGRLYYLNSSMEVMSMLPDGTDIQKMP